LTLCYYCMIVNCFLADCGLPTVDCLVTVQNNGKANFLIQEKINDKAILKCCKKKVDIFRQDSEFITNNAIR